ncbi:uncharacterized protein LOC119837378 [Zerene cesonia]|uniref:uncharacterized protein LOC119837378 n=1 Tax=Zerene cesonia TaxID=33412 RepID=UPI0018E55FC6|nr:uncharacterized protein LOC119837378 [Zerene cesonia]
MRTLFLCLVTSCFIILTTSESTEDDVTSYTGVYNQYAPSTVNFQDIYTNTLLAERERENEDLNLNIPTQYVEFHPSVLKISPLTPPTNTILTSSYLKKSEEGKDASVSTTTDEPEPGRVIPMRHQHKGVLDVLFPAARVRTFKNIFDTFRRVLSYTF